MLYIQRTNVVRSAVQVRPDLCANIRHLFDHALEHGSLKYKDLGRSREVKLDTSTWLAGSGTALTFTMGF